MRNDRKMIARSSGRIYVSRQLTWLTRGHTVNITNMLLKFYRKTCLQHVKCFHVFVSDITPYWSSWWCWWQVICTVLVIVKHWTYDDDTLQITKKLIFSRFLTLFLGKCMGNHGESDWPTLANTCMYYMYTHCLANALLISGEFNPNSAHGAYYVQRGIVRVVKMA